MTIRKELCLLGVAILIMTAAGGCGTKPITSEESAPVVLNPSGRPVDASTAGSVRGIVRLEGNPPNRRAINMAAVPNCSKEHASPALTEEVVPGDNGTLQNVVVYLKGDFSSYTFEIPKSPVHIDQSGCIYKPHVTALMVGQPLQTTNSDQATHNIHSLAKANRPRNDSQSPGAAPITQTFSRQEVAIQVKCNVHPWMRAYVAVVSNPYFQVTGEDGSFQIENVPPGKYELYAWHELFGVSEESVTIGPSESKSVTISFRTKQVSD